MGVLAVTKKEATRDWHRADIIASLKKKGWSLRMLAKEAGCNYSTIKSALDKPYPKKERLIASAIEVPPEVIWADRYAKRNFKPRLPNKLHM